MRAIRPGGHAIIATFAIDGPERCSGLPVMRYDATLLSAALGRTFALIGTRRHDHTTPTGGVQRFSVQRIQARIEQPSVRLGCFERLLEIGNDVVLVFDADR
jgi:hypothetical protein